MPKPSKYPLIINNMKRLCVQTFVNGGCIKQGYVVQGISNWTTQGEVTSSISFKIDYTKQEPIIILDYSNEQKDYSISIQITSVKSNLGKGKIYYFICPETKKRCKYLTLFRCEFIHRTALPYAFYESQWYSKKIRFCDKVLKIQNKHYKALDLIDSKHFKREYNKRLTKTFLNALNDIKNGQKVEHIDVERIIVT